MQRIAIQIRDLVRTINRAPGRQKEQDGRRRLASAAARTARQAADIKFRKTHNGPRPAIVVTGAEHDANAAACFASRAVWRCGAMMIPVVSSIVRVHAAMKPNSTNGSWNGCEA